MSTIGRLLSLPQPTPAEDYGFFGPDSVTWKVWSTPEPSATTPCGKRWEIGELDTVLPVLDEVFLGRCEVSVRRMLDGSQSWTPEGLAPIVGCAAYRALRARP